MNAIVPLRPRSVTSNSRPQKEPLIDVADLERYVIDTDQTGTLGRLGGMIMARTNAAFARSVISLLDVKRSEQVLGVGFGPGVGIQLLAKSAERVAGVDCSCEMPVRGLARLFKGAPFDPQQLLSPQHEGVGELSPRRPVSNAINSVKLMLIGPSPLRVGERTRFAGGCELGARRFSVASVANVECATGEAKELSLRPVFDRRIELEFHGARITSDGGLLAYRELDQALGLADMAITKLLDRRRGRNSASLGRPVAATYRCRSRAYRQADSEPGSLEPQQVLLAYGRLLAGPDQVVSAEIAGGV
jgi:hypothetical protein